MTVVRHSFVAWRSFCYGVDLTEMVSSVSPNQHDDRSPNMCEIVLSSLNDRFIITPTDIHAMYDDIDIDALDPKQLTDELESQVEKKLRERISRNVLDPVKQRVLLAKIKERFKGIEQPSIAENATSARAVGEKSPQTTNAFKFAAMKGEVARFPFQVGQCIFHTGDAVRIFFRDPYNASNWYFEFTGVVSDWRESAQANGSRTVTLTCECPLRFFRLSRFSSNPAIFDTGAVSDAQYDTLFRSWAKDNFKDLTLPEILYTMTFGTSTIGDQARKLSNVNKEDIGGVKGFDQKYYGVNGSTPRGSRELGVGTFDLTNSHVFSLGPSDSVTPNVRVKKKDFVGPIEGFGETNIEKMDSLEEWQRTIDTALPLRIDDVLKLALPDAQIQADARARLTAELAVTSSGTTTGLLTSDAVMTEIGTHPEVYPIEHGRLLVLIPETLGPGSNRSLLMRDLVQGIATQTEFTNRLAMIYNMCERIDFSFYSTPRGDLVCEMPLYSFRPEDFGEYADRYRFSLSDTIGFDSAFSDERIRTLMLTDYFVIPNLISTGKVSQIWRKPAAAYIKSLVPQFGVRAESIDSQVYLGNPEAATYYAYIKLARQNADAWQQNVSTCLRVGLGPNRPCWFEARDFIATVRAVGSSIVWGEQGSVNQTLKLNYRRGWSGLLTPSGAHVYEPFGGRMSAAIDYSMLFQQKSNASLGSTKARGTSKNNVEFRADTPASVVAANEKFVYERVVVPLAAALSAEVGFYVDPRAIVGSQGRTLAQQNALRDQGKAAAFNSQHLDGTAVDFPIKRLPPGVSGDMVANKLALLQATDKSFPKGHIEWKTTGHFDHAHYELDESPSKKTAWAEGER